MKVSKLICAVSLIVATTLSGAALAHEHKGGRHDAQPHVSLKHMLSGVELTDSQREQIKQLLQQHRQEVKLQQQELAAHQALQRLLLEEQYDELAARELLQQLQQQQVEKRLATFKLQHQIVQLLTEEQQEQLKQKQIRRQNKTQRQHETS